MSSAIVVALLASSASAIFLDCNYRSDMKIWELGSMFGCVGTVKNLHHESRKVKNVSLIHQSGISYNDVKFVRINNIDLKQALRNIGSFFPKLEAYEIASTGLLTIHAEDFHGMPNLKQISLNSNNIVELNSDLFKHTMELRAIQLNNNFIRNIDFNTFDHLSKLETLYFNHTERHKACISGQAKKSQSEVKLLIFKLSIFCPPTLAMTEANILNGFQFQTKVNSLMDYVKTMEDKLNELEDRMSNVESSIE